MNPDLVTALAALVASVVGGGSVYVALFRERTKVVDKASERDAEADRRADDNVAAARVDERDRCAERIAELREDIARLSGRIDEQGAELTEMRGRSDLADRRALIAEGRAMAMRSIAETAGADREMVRLIWERHDPATLQGRMPT